MAFGGLYRQYIRISIFSFFLLLYPEKEEEEEEEEERGERDLIFPWHFPP